MHRFGDANSFGLAALDVKALYMGATGCDWSDATSKGLASRLEPTRRGDHDALYQAELFHLIREAIRRA